MADTVNYKITEIEFSAKEDIKSAVDGSTNESSPQACIRTTKLIAHVIYEYMAFSGKESGTAVVDLSDICQVNIDEDGNLTNISTTDMTLTLDKIMSKVKEVVEKNVKSLRLREVERSQINSFLNQVRSIEGLPSRRSSPGLGILEI